MTEPTVELANKIALVTGASQGIGRACALTPLLKAPPSRSPRAMKKRTDSDVNK